MHHTASSPTLAKASLAAVLTAVLVLVVAILPAEFNIDPTGVGEKLGFTLLADNPKEAAKDSPSTSKGQPTEQVITVVVPANKGVEYKFQINQFDKLTYKWSTDGKPLYFDLHGEPQGDTTGYFESYAIATLNKMAGSFTAPFDGSHGWYWENTSNEPVSIQLSVNGHYQVIGLKP